MGRRKGTINKITMLPRGVTEVRDGRHEAKPFCVRHRDLPREFFALAELAVARKKELIELEKKHGAASLEYNRGMHAQVVEARGLLPRGVSIVDAARFWIEHHPAGESPLVRGAVQDFIAAKRAAAGGGKSYNIRDLKSRLRGFVLAFGERPVSDLTGDNVLAWLRSIEYEPRTVANYRNALQTFFNYAVRRSWLGKSPMHKITPEDLPRVRGGAKNNLSIAEANALIGLVRERYPEYLPHFALRLFLGFRTKETMRFRWEWIQPELGRVYIPAAASKTGDAWSIDDVPARFWRLLANNRFERGQVPVPKNMFKNGVKSRLRAEILAAMQRREWPNNGTRDTFCTLHISAYRDPQRTALVLKHRNSQTLWRSYLGQLVPQAEAQAFFEGD